MRRRCGQGDERPAPRWATRSGGWLAADWPLDGFNDHGTHEALYLRDPDGNGRELAWDRPEDQWPRDADGRLTFGNRQLDLEGLLREGVA